MTLQLDLFADIESEQAPTKPELAVRWLARQVVSAQYLLAVANGQLEAARSALSSSASGATLAGGVTWSVASGKVEYTHPQYGSGSVPVRTLIAVASSERDDQKAERLRVAYRAYVDEAVDGRVPFPLDWAAEPEQLAAARAHQVRYGEVSAALRDASDGWWSS